MKKILFYLFTLISLPQLIASTIDPDTKEKAQHYLKNQPVRFLENKGQMTDMANQPVPFVLFKAEAPGINMYITEKGITYVFIKAEEEEHEGKNTISKRHEEKMEVEWNRVDMNLKGAIIKKENIIKEGQSTDFKQYFLGHCPNGITDVRSYEKITIKEIYPGIDWVLYNSNNKGFKYDFIVHPGANATDIAIVYNSQKPIKLNEQGELEITTKLGNLTENKPYSYIQETNTEIKSAFKMSEKRIERNHYETAVSIELFNNENLRNKTIVIDPQLVWGTFVGGNADEGFNSIDCDNTGNVFVAGYSSSFFFPTFAAGAAYFSGTTTGSFDGVLMKFSNTGVMLWSTYYGGTGSDAFWSLDALPNGDFYVTGMSGSANFPTQTWGTAYFNNVVGGGRDVVVLKFTNAGVRVWATYYGGLFDDEGHSIVADPLGNVYITGKAGSTFPTKAWAGAFNDNTHGGGAVNSYDMFVLRFSSFGTLDWATYFGGPDYDAGKSITSDINGNIYITGDASAGFLTQSGIGAFTGAYFNGAIGGSQDAFIVRFANTGTLEWSTFYGGNQSENGHTIVAGSNGVFVLGGTDSGNFPVLSGAGAFAGAYFDNTYGGATDAFILHFNYTGIIDWSTYFGGSSLEYFSFNSFDNMEIDMCDNLYVAFATTSTDINTLDPSCGSFYEGSFNGGFNADGFITKFNSSGNLLWGSYIPVSNFNFRGALVTDKSGNLFVGGEAGALGTGFLQNPFGGSYFANTHSGSIDDSFIAKFIPLVLGVTQSQTNITGCNCDGTATVNLSCGEAEYSYIWSNGTQILNTSSATNVLNNLCPGSYTVTCYSNCDTLQANFTFAAVGGNVSLTSIITNSVCSLSNGSASVIPGGGTAPYTYYWSNSQTGNTLTNLSAGSYTVTVTESGGCTSTTTAIVNNTPAPTINSITPTTILCNGGSASATISASGTGTLSYLWSNGNTGLTANNLSAGTQNVTVTDGNGCLAIQSFTITEPTAISLSTTTVSNASCNQNNGSIAITNLTGGTGLYTYSWSNGASTQNISSLAANSYTLTVTDNNNCSATTSATVISNNGANISSLTKVDALCNGGTGTATVNITGGASGNYTYSWSNGANTITSVTSNQELLTSNTYTVTVIDGACSTTSVVSITAPPSITLGSITPTSASCGQSNGSAITTTATGGTGTLTYSWSNGNSGQTATNLSAQTYTLTVRDANNCSTTTTVNIGNTGGASISTLTKTDALCNGGTGNATVNITGGASGNYTYSWSNGSNTITTATSNQALLTSNTYTVTVIDGSCTVTSVVSITQPTPIVASAIQNTPASCGLNNGEAIASATGGNNSNYNYVWSNGTTTSTATGLSAGTYIITVTDANNCAQTTSVNISNSPAPTINSLTAVNPLCNGATGTASVTATGTGTLTYVWSNGNTTTTATNLTAGNYNITVTDGNGCKAIQSFSITEPSAITISNPVITNASCNQSNGAITLATPTGGTTPYTYNWSNGVSNGQSTVNNPTTILSNLLASIYTITITDNNGCITTTTANVSNTSGVSIINTNKNDVLCNNSTGSATVTIAASTAPYTYSWSNGASTITTATSNQEQLTSNSYTVTVTDANNCTTTTTLQINQPTVLSIATPITTDASCNQSNGSISITATGGTTPYTYNWSNGTSSITNSTTQQLNNLIIGNYSLTVTDANNCSTTTSITINNTNSSVNATVTSTISSNTISEGESIVLSGGGGTSYTWTPNNSLSCATCPVTIANPTATTTYTLIVKDNTGCADTTDITINVKKPCTGEEDVFIANVFSPNNDGKNDVLQIQGNGLTNIYFAIYDRWGNLMFETRDQAQGWDGSVNGNTANAGTYVYYLKATCKKTLQEIILKGNVSVLK